MVFGYLKVNFSLKIGSLEKDFCSLASNILNE